VASHDDTLLLVGMKDGVSNGHKFLKRTNIQRNEVLKSDFFLVGSYITLLSSTREKRSKTLLLSSTTTGGGGGMKTI
jgi:hypothetical protein